MTYDQLPLWHKNRRIITTLMPVPIVAALSGLGVIGCQSASKAPVTTEQTTTLPTVNAITKIAVSPPYDDAKRDHLASTDADTTKAAQTLKTAKQNESRSESKLYSANVLSRTDTAVVMDNPLVKQSKPDPSLAAPGQSLEPNVPRPQSSPRDIYNIKPPTIDVKARQKLRQQALLNQARAHSNQPVASNRRRDGNNLPAFRRLMQTGVDQLKKNNHSDAQSAFTQAQRLAPQSSAVYFYLGQIALKKGQFLKATAMAKRGLSVASSTSRKIALWQLALRAAQARGYGPAVLEAKQALSKLR